MAGISLSFMTENSAIVFPLQIDAFNISTKLLTAAGLWATSSTYSRPAHCRRSHRPLGRARDRASPNCSSLNSQPSSSAACRAAHTLAGSSEPAGCAGNVRERPSRFTSTPCHCSDSCSTRKSRPRHTMGAAPAPRAQASKLAGGSGSPMTTGAPRRTIPAFSLAMLARSVPSQDWWSRSIRVITATVGSTILTASRRPPSPTSSTSTSTTRSRNTTRAASVANSK